MKQQLINHISFRFVALIILSTCFSTLTIGCADDAQLNGQSVEKNYYDDYSYDDYSYEDDYHQDQQNDDYYHEGSSQTYSNEDYITVNGTSTTSVNPGDSCGSGCIWSAYAVNMGAQQSETACGNSYCACVVNGDIWSSCGGQQEAQPESPQSNEPQRTTPQSQGSYNASLGNQLADAAYYEAIGRNTVGWCYNAVADALESILGTFLWGQHAYQAADILASYPRFTEVYNADLRSLPAGAVVVWGRGSSRSGHISVALGDGREASDHVTGQMTYHYGGAPARVFYPR